MMVHNLVKVLSKKTTETIKGLDLERIFMSVPDKINMSNLMAFKELKKIT